MKDVDFYIEAIIKLLKRCDKDTVRAVYVVLTDMNKGDKHGR